MATEMGPTPEKKEYHLAPLFEKRDASKENSQGSMIVSCEIMFFVSVCSNHDRDEDVCLKWDDLAEQDFSHYMTYQMSESEYFHYIQNWWISLNKSRDTGGPLRNLSDFNQALSTLNPFTPRIWRTTTQAHAILEVPATATVIEFFFQLVAMERFLVVLTRIQRKSIKEHACKGLR